jgi:CTP-dependent riboflavin kinase
LKNNYYFDTVIHFIERTEKTVKEDIQDFYNNFNCSFIRLPQDITEELKDKRIIKVIKTKDATLIKLNEKGLILKTNEIFEK